MWMLATAAAGTVECGPGPGPGPRILELRGHRYRRIGQCRGVPVYRTRITDSTFADRDAAAGPVILVTRESSSPDSAGDEWPAPRGNVYLSIVLDLPPDEARATLTGAVDHAIGAIAPGLETTSGWDGDYGAHRISDGRFVSGLLSGTHPDGTAVGLDLHLRARPRAYERLEATEGHVSLRGLGYPTPTVDTLTWTLLRSLEPSTR